MKINILGYKTACVFYLSISSSAHFPLRIKEDIRTWFPVRSATKGYRISGRYACADGFGGAVVVNASLVSFDQQGRFAWKTVKGGNTSWKPIYSKSESAGTYSLEDHLITLSYNNGAKESFFFGLYPKDDQYFIIGFSHFTPADR